MKILLVYEDLIKTEKPMKQFQQHHSIRASNSLYEPIPPNLYSHSKPYAPLRFVNPAPNAFSSQEPQIYYPSPSKPMTQPQPHFSQRFSANEGSVSFSHRTQPSMYVQNPGNIPTSQVVTKFKQQSSFEENTKKITETSKALDSIKQELLALEKANMKRAISLNPVPSDKSPQKQQKQPLLQTELQFKPKNPDSLIAKRPREHKPSFYDINKVIPAHLLQSPSKQSSSPSEESPTNLLQSARLFQKTDFNSEKVIGGSNSANKESPSANNHSQTSQTNEGKEESRSVNSMKKYPEQILEVSQKATINRSPPEKQLAKSGSKVLPRSNSKDQFTSEDEKMWRNLLSMKVSEAQLKEQENSRLSEQIYELKKKMEQKSWAKQTMEMEYQSRLEQKKRLLSQFESNFAQKDSMIAKLLKDFAEREERYIKQIQFLRGKVNQVESSQSNLASKQFNQALKDQLLEIDQLKAKIESKEEEIAEMKETLLNKDSEMMLLKQDHQKEINIFKAQAKRAEISRDVESNDNANEQQSLRRALQSIESKLRVALKQIQEKDDFVGKCLVGRAKDLNDQEYIKALVKQYELQLPTYKIADKLVEEAVLIERLERELKVQQIMNTHY